MLQILWLWVMLRLFLTFVTPLFHHNMQGIIIHKVFKVPRRSPSHWPDLLSGMKTAASLTLQQYFGKCTNLDTFESISIHNFFHKNPAHND